MIGNFSCCGDKGVEAHSCRSPIRRFGSCHEQAQGADTCITTRCHLVNCSFGHDGLSDIPRTSLGFEAPDRRSIITALQEGLAAENEFRKKVPCFETRSGQVLTEVSFLCTAVGLFAFYRLDCLHIARALSETQISPD